MVCILGSYSYNLSSKLLAEYLGSLFLVVSAISPILLLYHELGTPIAIAVFGDAIAVAFVLAALIEALGPISGAHFNPIVSFAFYYFKKLTLQELILFIIVQILGGISGTIISHVMFIKLNGNLIVISEVTRDGGVFIAEIIGSFILVLIILLLVHNDSKDIPLKVGILVGGMLVSTSSTMFANPQVTIARMFTYSAAGVSIANGIIFIIMQIAGMVLAIVAYSLLINPISSIEEVPQSVGYPSIKQGSEQGYD